jgi:6,7-dimethyl-8-ribityllumazine synthase
MRDETHPSSRANGLRVGIAISRYHRSITDALLAGAVSAFRRADGDERQLVVVGVPGAFELPVVCRALAARDDVDAVVALGCVVRGETAHDQHIAGAVALGLTEVSLSTGKPVSFGVLTCQTLHQARERAGGERGNKGEEAMNAAIAALQALRDVARGAGAAGAAGAARP